MRVTLNQAMCSGHARCHAVDAELFPIDDDGYSVLEDFDVPDDRLAVVRKGVDACPELALSLVDDATE